MKQIKFLIIFAILTYVFSWLCKWLLMLEFAMKAYTPLGKSVMTYGQHTLFVFVAFVGTIQLTIALGKKAKK